MVTFQQSREEILNMFYCSFESDPSGQDCESLIEELLTEGFSRELILESLFEARHLASKYIPNQS